MKLYMAEISLPETFTEELIELIPSQREHIDQLLEQGVVSSYTLTADRTRLWVVLQAKSQVLASRLLDSFPIADYMQFTLTELMFHNTERMGLPALSLN